MNHEARKNLRTKTAELDLSVGPVEQPKTFCVVYPQEGKPPLVYWARSTGMRLTNGEGGEGGGIDVDCEIIPAPYPTFALRRSGREFQGGGLYLTRMEQDPLEGYVIDFGGDEHGIITFTTRAKAMEAAAFISGRVDGEIEVVQCEDAQ